MTEPKPFYLVQETKGGDPVLEFVPAGSLVLLEDDEQPVHTVMLDDFYIDRYEVANARYAECVDEGACQVPVSVESAYRSSYYGDPEYDDYPVGHSRELEAGQGLLPVARSALTN